MKQNKRNLTPYLLILPTLLFVLLFTVYPSLNSLVKSFFIQRLNIPKFREPVFAGWANYIDLLESESFRVIMGNTLRYVLISVPLTMLLSFLFALGLRQKVLAPLRVVFFHPAILPMVSAATVWLFFLTPDYGLFNQFLKFFGYNGPENWTTHPDRALAALILVSLWKDAGFYMIFFLSGLLSLPEDVFEALKLEGASPFTRLFRFILPLMKRTTLFVSTVAVIGAFRTVDHVFVMTQGGPSGASNLLLYHLWQVRFDSLNLGQASAITVVLVCILLIFTLTNFSLSERRNP